MPYKVRNYQKEYAREPKKRRDARCARNRARYKLEQDGRVRKGDGKHVHHKDGDPQNNGDSNLGVRDGSSHVSKHKTKGESMSFPPESITADEWRARGEPHHVLVQLEGSDGHTFMTCPDGGECAHLSETSRAALVSVTAGMANSLTRGRKLARICTTCKRGVPAYPGRYPARCPMCKGPLTPPADEAIGERGEYEQGASYTSRAASDPVNSFPAHVTYKGLTYYRTGKLGRNHVSGELMAEYEAPNNSRVWSNTRSRVIPESLAESVITYVPGHEPDPNAPAIATAGFVAPIQNLLEVGVAKAGGIAVPYAEVERQVPAGVRGLDWYTEGTEDGRRYRVEGPFSPVLIVEFDDNAREALFTITDEPARALGFDPRAEMAVDGGWDGQGWVGEGYTKKAAIDAVQKQTKQASLADVFGQQGERQFIQGKWVPITGFPPLDGWDIQWSMVGIRRGRAAGRYAHNFKLRGPSGRTHPASESSYLTGIIDDIVQYKRDGRPKAAFRSDLVYLAGYGDSLNDAAALVRDGGVPDGLFESINEASASDLIRTLSDVFRYSGTGMGLVFKHKKYAWFFMPLEVLKNGNLKGLRVDWDEGNVPTKAKQDTVDRYFADQGWPRVSGEGIPRQVRARFESKGRSLVEATCKPNKGKKWGTMCGGKCVSHGDPNAKIAPGTPRGDAYCARSAKIKDSGSCSPNALSRKKWKCSGSRSVGEGALSEGSQLLRDALPNGAVVSTIQVGFGPNSGNYETMVFWSGGDYHEIESKPGLKTEDAARANHSKTVQRYRPMSRQDVEAKYRARWGRDESVLSERGFLTPAALSPMEPDPQTVGTDEDRRASAFRSPRKNDRQRGTAIHGGTRFTVGGRKRKVSKDVQADLQRRINARRGQAKRIEAARKWHQSADGKKLHKDLGNYNRGKHRGESQNSEWPDTPYLENAMLRNESVLSEESFPGESKVLAFVENLIRTWQRKLPDMQIVLGGSLASGVFVPQGAVSIDADIRFLTDTPDMNAVRRVERVTGLTYRKTIQAGDWPSGTSVSHLVEGFIDVPGIELPLELECQVRNMKYVGWARLYPKVLTSAELAEIRAGKIALRGDKAAYKAFKAKWRDEVEKRAMKRGIVRTFESVDEGWRDAWRAAKSIAAGAYKTLTKKRKLPSFGKKKSPAPASEKKPEKKPEPTQSRSEPSKPKPKPKPSVKVKPKPTKPLTKKPKVKVKPKPVAAATAPSTPSFGRKKRNESVLHERDPYGQDTARWVAQGNPGLVTQSDLNGLERVLDALFAKAGLDIEFTRHFLDRVNDRRNKRQITIDELSAIFREVFQRHASKIRGRGADWEAVIADLTSDINIPFVLNYNRRDRSLELVAKTVMRKRGFKTRNKMLTVQTAAERIEAARARVDSLVERNGKHLVFVSSRASNKEWGTIEDLAGTYGGTLDPRGTDKGEVFVFDTKVSRDWFMDVARDRGLSWLLSSGGASSYDESVIGETNVDLGSRAERVLEDQGVDTDMIVAIHTLGPGGGYVFTDAGGAMGTLDVHLARGAWHSSPLYKGDMPYMRLPRAIRQRLSGLRENMAGSMDPSAIPPLASGMATQDPSTDDIFDSVLRRLIVIESSDVLEDVNFDENGSIYLFFDPSLSRKEIDEVHKWVQHEHQNLALVASPDQSLPDESVRADWWVMFLPGKAVEEGVEVGPDPEKYARPEDANGEGPRRQMMVPSQPTPVDQIAMSVDTNKLMKGLGEAARWLAPYAEM